MCACVARVGLVFLVGLSALVGRKALVCLLLLARLEVRVKPHRVLGLVTLRIVHSSDLAIVACAPSR